MPLSKSAVSVNVPPWQKRVRSVKLLLKQLLIKPL
jgi:hypothetical protein